MPTVIMEDGGGKMELHLNDQKQTQTEMRARAEPKRITAIQMAN